MCDRAHSSRLKIQDVKRQRHLIKCTQQKSNKSRCLCGQSLRTVVIKTRTKIKNPLVRGYKLAVKLVF